MSGKNELLNDFVLETMENIQQANNSLKVLEKSREDKEHINAVYRCMHTLKSSAGLMGFQKTQELAHLVENILDDVREDVCYLDDILLDALIVYLDETYEQLKSIERTGDESHESLDKLKLKFLSLQENVGDESKISDLRLYSSSSEPELDQQGDDKEAVSLDDNVLNLKQSQHTRDEANSVAAVEEEVIFERKSVADTTIRVNVGLLDKIMNKVGELVLNRNQILQFTNEHNNPILTKLSQELNVITTELQTDIMVTRMQPIGSVLQKFERVLRDFCRSSGKKIRLKLHGEETELDKSLIEMIKDPLTHIVRNSMDHGVETPEERLAAGKNEEAKITVRAYHESGQVTIEVQDDGRGLSRDKIGQKAVERGLVSSESLAQMSDEKVFSFIFYPGFSTAQAVTKVSGRGVGMDVVRTNVEKIGGSIHLSSEEGRSTTIKLKIPLTLAIIPALTIKSCGEIFAIPQANVFELVRFEGDESEYIEKVLSSEFIRLRGKLIPIFRINESLDLKTAQEKTLKSRKALENYLPTTALKVQEVEEAREYLNEANIIILSAEGTEFGLIVEEILDTEEIVVKPLEKYLAGITHFAGATIMGNGDVALIIDALGFYNSVKGNQEEHLRVEVEDELNNKGEYRDIHENLLFKLSDERVYSAPLSLISRLEEVKKRDIERVGDSLVVRYNQKPMILIELSKRLKLSEKICSLKNDLLDSIKILVVHNNESYYGLIVEDILDISITEAVVDSDVIDRPGFLGTLYLDGQIVTLINIHQIIEDMHLGEKNLPEDERVHHIKKIKNKTLLVVEDSPVYRKMEVDTFKSLGFKVLSAVNGQEGLEKLMENKEIDIVVTDIEMPIMNGFEFCRKLRTMDEFKSLPVIAISTKVTQKDKATGEEVGFTQHLEKFKREEVIDVITSFFA